MKQNMNEFSDLVQPDKGQDARPIHILDKAGLEDWLKAQPERTRAHLLATRFSAKPHEVAIIPGDNPDAWQVVAGVADAGALKTWCLAKAADALPEGAYRLVGGEDASLAMIGWMLAQHRFTRYRKPEEPVGPRRLLTGQLGTIEARRAEAEASAWVRDMVDTPAEDMGPDRLEEEAERLAARHGAKLEVTRGDALEQGYPMIHSVGRAAKRDHAPRLIEIHWGRDDHPRLAIVGKGVCFDSGGLDIKSSTGMLLMKKDMGGAAHALALGELVMRSRLPVRLHILVAAVENAIAGNAFRPGDVLRSRKGLTVEIGNTDAEGRLVLGDALTKACENTPELLIDFATLTGAARVALGPDLPAMFASSDALGTGLLNAGQSSADPVWRLPLWSGYDDMLSSDIADTGNAGGGFAGSITAALFLRKFVPDGIEWAHFDTFAWRPTARPGQPKGGEALGLRATWRYLQQRFGKDNLAG